MEPWLHLDLTTAQVKTLAVLADREPETIGQAAEMLGITLADREPPRGETGARRFRRAA